MRSRQGIHIAFIGMNDFAQTACALYLVKKYDFKRMELDEYLKHFLRSTYGYHERKKFDKGDLRVFYDSLYAVDNNLFITQFKRNFGKSELDVVVSNVRYLQELKQIKELGFTIVRVTTAKDKNKYIKHYIKSASEGTVALSMLYDKSFAAAYNVDYSINFTNYPNLPAIIDPILEDLGYKFDTTT